MALPPPKITSLAREPKTVHRLNCNAFQQHGITSAFGWQYAVFYVSDEPHVAGSPRFVCVARRRHFQPFFNDGTEGLSRTHSRYAWQHVVLRDYVQTTEDGHNTISLGISEGDGRLHLVWDLHNDQLRYRRSIAGLAWNKDLGMWNAESFGQIENGLQPGTGDAFRGLEVTYPRFVSIAGGTLLFEFRVGKAGNGHAALCRYERVLDPYTDFWDREWHWKFLGI